MESISVAGPSIRAARPAGKRRCLRPARAGRASAGRAPARQRVRQRARYGLYARSAATWGQRYRVLDARAEDPPPLPRLRPLSLADRDQHLAGSGVRASRHRASSAGASRIGRRMASIPAGTGGALANMSPFRNLGGETARHLLGTCAGRAGCRYAASDLRLTQRRALGVVNRSILRQSLWVSGCVFCGRIRVNAVSLGIIQAPCTRPTVTWGLGAQEGRVNDVVDGVFVLGSSPPSPTGRPNGDAGSPGRTGLPGVLPPRQDTPAQALPGPVRR